MTAHLFELTFQVHGMTPTIEDALYEGHDVLVAQHDGVTLVTVDAEGTDCFSAAIEVVSRLHDAGLEVSRMVEDFVSASEIASRAGLTRPAVAQYVAGKRQAKTPFPQPINFAPERIWLWGEVVDWFRERGVSIDAGTEYPKRSDYPKVNFRLDCPTPDHKTWRGVRAGRLELDTPITGPGAHDQTPVPVATGSWR